jgi:hypothetical protein
VKGKTVSDFECNGMLKYNIVIFSSLEFVSLVLVSILTLCGWQVGKKFSSQDGKGF